MDKMKFLRILLIILIVIGGVSLGIILSENAEKAGEEKADVFSQLADEPEECQVKPEEKIVRGGSLDPLIKDGEIVKVFWGYYDCNDIKRDDVVLYSYAGNEAPLIKIVRGVPGDKFNLWQTDGGWHILINGEVLKNSEGIPYLISGKRYEMLSLYEKDYGGIIPKDAYLIMGNLVSGSIDSTRYGLIDKSDILGKVEY
ncbi:MAG: signal peptidase I [Candidatus Nealsonbacteria bacterium]|nr:signal peptidase I [Candidatus Nealsonbacteria bacterium]